MIIFIVVAFMIFVVVMLYIIAKGISSLSFESSIPRWQWDALKERFNDLELELEKLK